MEILNNAKVEFEAYLKKWVVKENRFGNGIDVGCGTSRIDNMIVSIDRQANYMYAHSQLVWNCKDLELFTDNVFDFIFSSHCLEDFEDIPQVFKAWWKKLKIGGYMLLLLPDMEKCDCQFCNGKTRYATIEDYKANGVGNPSHRTNVGKKYITSMLEKSGLSYKIEQIDTIPHYVSCSIDFVIKKVN